MEEFYGTYHLDKFPRSFVKLQTLKTNLSDLHKLTLTALKKVRKSFRLELLSKIESYNDSKKENLKPRSCC